MPAGVHAEAESKTDAHLRREAANAQLDAEDAAQAAASSRTQGEHQDTQTLSGTTAVGDDGEEGIRASEDTAVGGEGRE